MSKFDLAETSSLKLTGFGHHQTLKLNTHNLTLSVVGYTNVCAPEIFLVIVASEFDLETHQSIHKGRLICQILTFLVRKTHWFFGHPNESPENLNLVVAIVFPGSGCFLVAAAAMVLGGGGGSSGLEDLCLVSI
ncbi:hypothetical protein LWI28_008248 [Acer negundo]|uniref:Uncharacterized protein n=1 Tax=Acer negundo TaxID=4023 RepID=A0AAD5J580_ACENE|nr:hypothetical protein LWI28_008248 [Acer negundo]